jgi:hypothetical protein
MVMNPAGLRPERDCAGEAQQNYRIVLTSERLPIITTPSPTV